MFDTDLSCSTRGDSAFPAQASGSKISEEFLEDELLEENIDAYDQAMDKDFDDGISQPSTLDELEEEEEEEDEREEEDNIPPSETNDELNDYNDLEF